MGLAHRKRSLIINLLRIGLLLSALLCWNLGSLTAWLILATASLTLVASVLSLNQHIMTWILKIREMEKNTLN